MKKSFEFSNSTKYSTGLPVYHLLRRGRPGARTLSFDRYGRGAHLQQEVAEARLMFVNQFNASLGGARDVREPAILATRGIMIEASVLLDIRLTLRRATTLKRTLGRMKRRVSPAGRDRQRNWKDVSPCKPKSSACWTTMPRSRTAPAHSLPSSGAT